MLGIKDLPIELQKVAEKELAEIPERRSKDIEDFKLWIQQQPHLNARLDEQFLIQYLRCSRYDLEKAKKKIHLFFTLKTRFPEISNVTDVNDKKFRKMCSYGVGVPLPRPLNDNGSRIIFVKYDGDVAKGLVDMNELYSVAIAMLEIMIMEDPYACINGITYILDLKDNTAKMAEQFSPQFLTKVVNFIEHSLPFYICSINFINVPPLFLSGIDLLCSIYSEKIRQRMHVYGENYEEIYKLVPKKYFPFEYGGENGSRLQLLKDYDKKWLEYADYFKENANYGTNEKLRPGKPIDFNSLYGWGGTLCKLELD